MSEEGESTGPKIVPGTPGISPYFVDTHRNTELLLNSTGMQVGSYMDPGTVHPVVVRLKDNDHVYGFFIACPGCGRVGFMRAGNPKPKTNPSWVYTGGSPQNPIYISLEPGFKLRCCGWSGKITDGQFLSEDGF